MTKIALVIGGTGGIGSGITRAFIKKGLKVCATYFQGEDAARKLSREFGDERFSAYRMDVSDGEAVEKVVNGILKDFKCVDTVVFLPALPLKHSQFFGNDWEAYQAQLDVQVRGLFHVVKALAPQIKARHRTRIIVVITEACAGRPPAGVSDYVTAKYALMGLARALASELARYNCTVNMISPGMTATSFIAGLPPKLAEMTAEQNPMKRIAQPDDIAGVAAFLASDEADYLNGVNIPVNGGAVMS